MTPDGIRNKFFTRALRGWKATEVQSYLENVAAEVERLNAVIQDQERQIAELRAKIEDYRVLEHTMTATIEQSHEQVRQIQAQTAIDTQRRLAQLEEEHRTILDQARQSAQLIKREAEQKSKAFLANANTQLKRLHDQISLLHAQRIAMITRFKSVLLAQVEFLDALMRDAEHPRLEALQLSDLDVARHGLDAAQLDAIVRRLEEMERPK